MKQLAAYGSVAWLMLTLALASQGQDSPAKTKTPQLEGNTPKAEGRAPTPAERYRDLLRAYQKAQSDFFTAYQTAKTDAERTKILETKRPDQQAYASKMLKIAQDAPKDPIAVEALIWVSLNS